MFKKKLSWTICFCALFSLIFTAAAGAATISTSDSWNLKSSLVEIDVATAFGADSTKFASVWKWIPGAYAKWAVYLPGESTLGEYATAKGFADLTTISPGEGFWVNSKGTQSVTVTAPRWT